MNKFRPIVDIEIALVDNAAARHALYDSYAASARAVERIEAFFDQFTARAWSQEARNTFFRNWRSPGIGAASFCALTFRLMEAAENTDDDRQRPVLYRCATRASEVSREDVGIGTTDHQKLYEDFATRLAGNDQWKLDSHVVPGLKRFINASRHYRQAGADLGRAMLISLPEELYNHGEFAYCAARFSRWQRDVLARPRDSWGADLKFIHDHLGDTERGHFAALVRGFEDYCTALSVPPDWDAMYQANVELLDDMAHSYDKLYDRIVELDRDTARAPLAMAPAP
ncbi:hypothetical protein [Bordetella genomosp. 13]|uniref:DUF3865 domain-containing protein n=1 Tax=Bordetella genomosp. 13 TaxID=463040 RepID=A0A1W6ZGL7_9BORD|nr:hypothetical protein [Bordetella genomosp. 13]ARP96548.1 hypothetical protein CAL15_20590 [Bordetella genomosp. 13]